ncbi:MAG: type II secretion system F family protein [Oscillospiraceae bacterium]|nr:type II secretion system F family protein [Oscillospiraceae bacterium]
MPDREKDLRKPARDMLSNSEIAAFCAQVAMIMKSGIAVSEGISIMHADMENNQGRVMLEQMLAELEMGAPFHQALDKTGKFPQYVIDMTEMGERSGKLDDVMDSLCVYYEREEAVSKNIRSAVTYPLIMITMMLLVIIVLIVNVLPVFNQVFLQLGTEMSGFSRTMMDMGQVLGRYSIAIIIVAAVLLAAFFAFRKTATGRQFMFNFKSRFFATRKLMTKIASGRFASTMSLMLSSGLDVDQSLDMAHKIVENPRTREKIANCKKLMEGGDNFSDAIVKADIFTGIHARMISVGFKTGSVDSVMDKIADAYDEEVESQIGNIISILEPTLVAVLSIIMGLILLSVMLPLMGIMTSIG